ncbi:MAG: A/G-specific adenine glycosylase [Bacteroidota bacterium]
MPITPQDFSQKLLTWYISHHRQLPWRQMPPNPYKIWISEVILQQTRVRQAIPYYEKFIDQYPNLQTLATAPEAAVLRAWQGLGYYTRARNLHACAQIIFHQYNNIFPNNYLTLRKLPGLGPYTAAAIASIAFGEAVPVVDGNVYRVLARIFGLTENISTPQGQRAFHKLAQSLLDIQNPGRYNQAIMEFGALQCKPVHPSCTDCTFQSACQAFHTGRQHELPVKNAKVKVKERFLHYFVIQDAEKVYMKPRPQGDIWSGLYDFHLVEQHALAAPTQLTDPLVALMQDTPLTITPYPQVYKHMLTHRKLYVRFFHVEATPPFRQAATSLLSQMGASSFSLQEVKSLPKPILVHNFLEEHFYA